MLTLSAMRASRSQELRKAQESSGEPRVPAFRFREERQTTGKPRLCQGMGNSVRMENTGPG